MCIAQSLILIDQFAASISVTPEVFELYKKPTRKIITRRVRASSTTDVKPDVFLKYFLWKKVK